MKQAELLLFPPLIPSEPSLKPLLPPQKILCVALPTWPSDRVRRRRAELGKRPLAIINEVGNRRTVISTCAAASASHVRVGMSLAEARVMCPALLHSPYEPERDAVALNALARWMAMRFTPIVSIEGADALFLDIGGCERLFGGIETIVMRVRDAMKTFGIAANFAVAGTPGAAWAFARFSSSLSSWERAGESLRAAAYRSGSRYEPSRAISATKIGATGSTQPVPPVSASPPARVAYNPWHPERERSDDGSLASLPPAALRISSEISDTLFKLGITTIRQLADLPRNALPSRFGKDLLLRLDQAMGRVPEPLVAVQCRTPIVVSREWDGPVESLEALAMVLDQLLVEAIVDLERRGQGVRRMEITFRCPYAMPIAKTLALSRASRDLKNLKRLVRCMLDALEAVEGFNGIKIRIAVSEAIVAARQSSLVDVERESAEDEIESLVERLKIRLGDAALERAEVIDSYLPERSVKFTPPAVRSDRTATRNRKRAVTSIDALTERIAVGMVPNARCARPLRLLTLPIEIGVMVSPSDDCEGFPIFFTHAANVHRLKTIIGPERISSAWWTGHNKSRDYFDVTDDDGKRFWIFRVEETRKWYIHGVF